MFSQRYPLRRLVIFAGSAIVLILLVAADDLSAQTEAEFLEKAAVKIKVGELCSPEKRKVEGTEAVPRQLRDCETNCEGIRGASGRAGNDG